ncbi:MAG: fasciclin domain-containing protein [Verrucomicrobiota bacterium]|nr:fasciclin domain-containing protein [Verrucomicrobiota bacterium]
MKTLLAFFTLLSLLLAPAASAAETIYTKLKEAGTFTLLITALEATGQDRLMQFGTGPYTFFAPTDAAFAKLPLGFFEHLLRPENKDKLDNILDYHRVHVRLDSIELRPSRLKTQNVTAVLINVFKGPLITVNGVEVIQADVEASNGVIHIIDTVLMPK